MGSYRIFVGYQLRRPVRLAGWALSALAAALLLGPAAAPLGPATFEGLRFLTALRIRRRLPAGFGGGRGSGRGGPGGWGPPPAGVREPRRPLPTAGAGAMAAPLPVD